MSSRSDSAARALRYVLALVALLAVGMLLLGPVTWLIAGDTIRDIKSPAERAAKINDVRDSLSALLGPASAAVGLIYVARTYYLTRRGHLTDRYARSVTQLSSENLVDRLGGVYGLEQVMRESDRDHETIVEILAAFVRTQSVRPGRHASMPVEEDVAAAMTVLARRPDHPEKYRMDLRGADLRGLELLPDEDARCPRLAGVDLCGAELVGARLPRVDLTGAWLAGTDLTGTDLTAAELSSAWLTGAALRKTDLRDACLTDAKLDEAVLDRVRFDRADLTRAWLNRATQRDCWFGGATLDETWLLDVDMRGSQSVGEEQLLKAGYLRSTKPPDHLRHSVKLAQLSEEWENRPPRYLPEHPFLWPFNRSDRDGAAGRRRRGRPSTPPPGRPTR